MPKFSVGNRQLFYSCRGFGTPTVVFEPGLGDTVETWDKVEPVIAQFTRTFSYDRAGLGQSDPASTPRTCQDMVDDLTALLSGADITPPYILVGHSFGGMIVRLYASQHRDDIAGMALVDASHEGRMAAFEKILSEQLIARNRAYLSDPSKNSECVDQLKSTNQLQSAEQRFEFPLVVLTRGLPDEPSPVWPNADLQRAEQELQREFLKLSPRSTLVMAEKSGHFIQKDQPELVIKAIRYIIGK